MKFYNILGKKAKMSLQRTNLIIILLLSLLLFSDNPALGQDTEENTPEAYEN